MTTAAPSESPVARSGTMSPINRFLERFGHLVSGILLAVMYFGLVLPGGLLLRFVKDPLGIKKAPTSNWHPWPSDSHSVKRARRQD